jgi:hypothetical protein
LFWCESQEKIDYLFGQAKNERLLKLLKIGAQVQVTVRRVVVRLASSYPFQELFIRIYRRLQGLEELRC